MPALLLIVSLLCGTLHAYESPAKYLPLLVKQPKITYGQIAGKLFLLGRDPETGEPATEIEYHFIDDTTLYPGLTAVDPSLLRSKDIRSVGKNHILVTSVPDDRFNGFALLFDKNGSLEKAALIRHRAGNSEWSVEREWRYEGFAGGSPLPRIVVTDLRRDTEWFEPGMRGYRKLSGRNRYELTADLKSGTFAYREIPLEQELAEADGKLNTLYRALMKRYGYDDRKTLRAIQRAWVS